MYCFSFINSENHRNYISFTESVSFWFDAIHCYWSTTEHQRLDPPIIVVCTHEDKFEVSMCIPRNIQFMIFDKLKCKIYG